MRKPVFRVSDQVQHKPGCTATKDGLKLEILDIDSTVQYFEDIKLLYDVFCMEALPLPLRAWDTRYHWKWAR